VQCGIASYVGPKAGLPKELTMAHSLHRRHKGCQLCKPHKHRDAGQAVRQPWPALRRLGKRRRVDRHDLGDAND
jgi:hypothetical protein